MPGINCSGMREAWNPDHGQGFECVAEGFGLDYVTWEKYVQFEKQHGDRRGIEGVITSKKRFAYEEQLKADPYLYDAWFDYVRLEEEDNQEGMEAAV